MHPSLEWIPDFSSFTHFEISYLNWRAMHCTALSYLVIFNLYTLWHSTVPSTLLLSSSIQISRLHSIPNLRSLFKNNSYLNWRTGILKVLVCLLFSVFNPTAKSSILTKSSTRGEAKTLISLISKFELLDKVWKEISFLELWGYRKVNSLWSTGHDQPHMV